MKKFLRNISVLIIISKLSLGFSQSFDVDQMEQIYRPRVKLDSRYIFNSTFSDTVGKFNDFYSNAVITFPIKSRLDADFKLDLSDLSLKKILKNSVKVNVSQTLGSIRIGYRQMNVGFDSVLPSKKFYTCSANLMGLRLDKKFRVVFYNLGLSLFEQDKTIQNSSPRFNALVGRMHVKGLVKRYFYGVAFVYSDGLFLPLPFFGGATPLSEKFILNYTIPATLNLQYKSGKINLFLGVAADGFRSGMEMNEMRTNLNHTAGQVFLMLRHKINNSVNFRVEGGYYFYSKLNISNSFFNAREYSINPGPYINFGFNILFGETIFQKITDKMLK